MRKILIFVFAFIILTTGVSASECLTSPKTITGSVGDYPDYDSHLIGNCASGDAILIENTGENACGLVLFNANDKVTRSFGVSPSLFKKIKIKGNQPQLSLIVFNCGGDGSYSVSVKKMQNDPAERSPPKKILLDFDGTDAPVWDEYPYPLPSLEDSWLGVYYPGQIDHIKSVIKQSFETAYAEQGLNVQIFTTDQPLPAAPYSIIYFGGNCDNCAGITLNGFGGDKALITIDVFEQIAPLANADIISKAISVVALHESGHMAGALDHVVNPDDFMDPIPTLSDLTVTRHFTYSDLVPTMYPLGKQNEPNLFRLLIGDDAYAECFNGLDDDGDGEVDYPSDEECYSLFDNYEGVELCEDSDGGEDIYHKGQVSGTLRDDEFELLSDQCISQTGLREFYCNDDGLLSYFMTTCLKGCSDGRCNPPQCSDGIDNDNDGLIDWPDDASCFSEDDDSETSECNDGIDNDGDGKVDLADAQCFGPQDDFEDMIPSCSDGWDYISKIGRCMLNGYTLRMNYDESINYCVDNGGYTSHLASDSELTQACDEIDLRQGDGVGSVRVADGKYTGHKTWHDKGYHFTSSECGEVSYDFCGTISKNAKCGDVEGWVRDTTDFGFVCLDKPTYYSATKCNDNIDNDNDGFKDWPEDPSCYSRWDDSEVSACNDGVDNDLDGKIDMADAQCFSLQDDSETFIPACPDGWDYISVTHKCVFNGYELRMNYNDAVGYCESYGFGSHLPSEFEMNQMCNEINLRPGDNRGTIRISDAEYTGHKTWHDKGYHFTNDLCGEVSYDFCGSQGINSNCESVGGWVEDLTTFGFACVARPQMQYPKQCQDALDNDGDGAIDYPADFSCESATDNDEYWPRPKCDDNFDNDGDGAIDYPYDFSCDSNQKDSDYETLPRAQCQDSKDNDRDGAIDYPADSSCTSLQDNDELNEKTECQDGLDNDDDGQIDLVDSDCATLQDGREGFSICPPEHIDNGDGTCTANIAAGKGDGFVMNYGNNWDIVRDANTGDTVAYQGTNLHIYSYKSSWGGGTYFISRAFLPFDTSVIPDDSRILNAKLSFWTSSGGSNNQSDGLDFISVVMTKQDSISELTTADFDVFEGGNSPTEGSYRWNIPTWESAGENYYLTLNNHGKSWINQEGWTLLGLREGHDLLNVNPESSGDANKIAILTSDHEYTYWPRLIVKYEPVITDCYDLGGECFEFCDSGYNHLSEGDYFCSLNYLGEGNPECCEKLEITSPPKTDKTIEKAETNGEETSDVSVESVEKGDVQEAEAMLSPAENLWAKIKDFFAKWF